MDKKTTQPKQPFLSKEKIWALFIALISSGTIGTIHYHGQRTHNENTSIATHLDRLDSIGVLALRMSEKTYNRQDKHENKDIEQGNAIIRRIMALEKINHVKQEDNEPDMSGGTK